VVVCTSDFTAPVFGDNCVKDFFVAILINAL